MPCSHLPGSFIGKTEYSVRGPDKGSFYQTAKGFIYYMFPELPETSGVLVRAIISKNVDMYLESRLEI